MTTLAQEFGFTAEQAKAVVESGFELVDAGDLQGALTIFDGLLVLNPEDGGIHAARGAVLQEQGKLGDAEEAYNCAIEMKHDAVLARLNRGELRLRRGDRSGVDDLQVAASIESPLRERAKKVLASART